MKNLPSFGHAWNASWEEIIGEESSNTDHSKTSVLQFLGCHGFLSSSIHSVPLPGPVNGSRAIASVRLALLLSSVLDAFDGSAEDNELCPPLRVGFHDSLDGVLGGHIVGVEGTNVFGPEPSNGGQHGGASIGQFGFAKVFNGGPLSQVKGVELQAILL